jgi:hypothetical protein
VYYIGKKKPIKKAIEKTKRSNFILLESLIRSLISPDSLLSKILRKAKNSKRLNINK